MTHRRLRAVAAIVAAIAGSAGAALASDEQMSTAAMAEHHPPAPPSAVHRPSDPMVERTELTADWGGSRTTLKELGVSVRPRLTQFYQGLTGGDGEHGFEYGGKLDLGIHADLHKLGLWNGLSLTLQADYNFGNSVNGRGGALIPVNTALNVPGMDGSAAFDLSSLYVGQTFGDSVSMIIGKINMIETVSVKPFMGGAGIDAFWNQTFVATPTGTVPPYLFGALTSVRTEPATYRLWIYDPISAVNKSSLNDLFADGVAFRASVEFPVNIAGRPGHQGFTAFYSTQDGTDFESLDDIYLPAPVPGTVTLKDSRYYFAYSFDQTLYQAIGNPEENIGVFGLVGLSDGNPNGLHWSFLFGFGGRGPIPGRNRDNWGIGYYYDRFSQSLKDALAPATTLRDEQGLELFYNFVLAPWFDLGLDLQIIKPGLASATAVVPGVRVVIRL